MAKKKKRQRLQVGIRLTPDQRDALAASAEWQGRSMNGQAIRYLEYCLIREGWLEGEVQLELLEE